MYRLFSRFSVVAAVLAALLVTGPAGSAAAAPLQAGSAASCRVLTADVFVREGPGMAFDAVAKFIQGTVLQATGFVKTGVPDGSWVQVQQQPGRPIGFAPADPRVLSCSVAPNTLTPLKTPPAPPAEDDPEARTRINGDNLGSAGIVGAASFNDGVYMIVPGVDQARADEVFAELGQPRFGDGVGFGLDVRDRRKGQTPGAGIEQVEFVIRDGEGDIAYRTIERNPPFCIFSDENGRCNVLRFSKMGYRWPDTALARGAARPLEDAFYTADITITTQDGREIVWQWPFELGPLTLELR